MVCTAIQELEDEQEAGMRMSVEDLVPRSSWQEVQPVHPLLGILTLPLCKASTWNGVMFQVAETPNSLFCVHDGFLQNMHDGLSLVFLCAGVYSISDICRDNR